MKPYPTKPVRKLIAAWVCLCVYLLCTSGLMAWGGGVYSILEGEHGVSVRVQNQQWVVVLDHGAQRDLPQTFSHHHDFLTDIITAFSIDSTDETDHILSGQSLNVVLDDQSTAIPEPPTYSIESSLILDHSEPWSFAPCDVSSAHLESIEPIQYTCFVHIPTVRLII